jgi:hypothetical protein
MSQSHLQVSSNILFGIGLTCAPRPYTLHHHHQQTACSTMSSLFNQHLVSHGPFQAPWHQAPNSFATTNIQPQIHTSFYSIINTISNPHTQPSSHQHLVPQWTNCCLCVHYLIQPPDPPPAQPLAHSTTTPSPTHQSALLSTLPLVYVQLSPIVYQVNQPKGPQ